MMLLRVLMLLALGLLAACGTRERLILLPAEDGGDPGGVALIKPNDEELVWWTTPFVESRFADGVAGGTRELRAGAFLQEFGPLLSGLPPAPKAFLLYFVTGTASLDASSRSSVRLLLEEVAARPGADVQVTGHTDTLGSHEDNDRLSVARAEEVAGLLTGHGLDPGSIRIVGRGERELLVPTGDGVREPRNQRVEVIVR